ncbi:hypothetical protein [Actinoplanes sp. NPDC020271]|uniref:hypothetical protein n=1 Tax=Actinoplanes sp. NPDC020271 TaxID=3363896 RepID=UPI00379370AC
MTDVDGGASDPGPQTTGGDGPADRELDKPVETSGGGAAILLMLLVLVLPYGFLIFMSAENGHDMSTLRWSIPFTLISLTAFGLGWSSASVPWDRLSAYCTAKGWGWAVNALSVAQLAFGFLVLAGNICTIIGFVISVVSSIDVSLVA